MEEHGILQYSVMSQFKASVVERWNRTLKNEMWRYFTHKASHRWLEYLSQIVKAYNNAYHRMIDRAPKDVNAQNEMSIWLKNENKISKPKKSAKYKVGDYVRLHKIKGTFAKGYLSNWTEEIFTVSGVMLDQSPVKYKVKDYDGNEIEGAFYEQELNHVTKPETYKIEEVIKTRKKQGSSKKSI